MFDSTTSREIECPPQAPSAMADISTWSTAAIHPRERFSYWREAVCSAVFGISIEASSDHFSACMTARSSGPFRFAKSESIGYHVVRNRRDIASSPSDHYSIYLQLSGQTVSMLADETVAFSADDIGIYDGREPFRAAHAGRRAIAVVPRAMIDQRAPWLRGRPPRKFTSRSSFLNIARCHLMELSSGESGLSESATSLLTDNLCNMVALATASDIPSKCLQPELQVEALLAFCRQNLHDPELSPQRAAEHLGISIRTLHSRFRQIGQTFGHWVLDNRLEACRTALRDHNHRTSNISEIAYRWGFNDLSYFNKAFRARFDMTPGEWRNGQATLSAMS